MFIGLLIVLDGLLGIFIDLLHRVVLVLHEGCHLGEQLIETGQVFLDLADGGRSLHDRCAGVVGLGSSDARDLYGS